MYDIGAMWNGGGILEGCMWREEGVGREGGAEIGERD
jgi:hypothetical protein